MKKSIITVFILLITASLCVNLSACSDSTNKVVVGWDDTKWQFENYEIIGDKVRFACSMPFYNKTEDDEKLGLSFKFNQSELSGWVEGDWFETLDKDGNEKKIKIKAHSKKRVTMYFEGDYLGGKVNENLGKYSDAILVY